MGIIDEKVWITLSSNNMNYYKNLGYEIPKRKDKEGNIKQSVALKYW